MDVVYMHCTTKLMKNQCIYVSVVLSPSLPLLLSPSPFSLSLSLPPSLSLSPFSLQGAYSEYRFNKVDPNPLLAVTSARSHKRPKLTTELSQEDKENIEDPIKRRRQAADEAFGTNPLPKLEKFSIQVYSTK